ncbi:hypothetical protein AV530_015363 [Patagioenas fasciata monilis]|uniref:28S ribosomal protein S18b, mitochondrial n=2 Tax=Patagioenas fasciata TaxID=372321 RepID=A0A1V4J4M2_PATFA|nr:hypothetical protein AV530_015363 [Patagioenas fasciata monilis]
MKQHKLLTKAVAQAQDHGLLWLHVPYVSPPHDDFSNRHLAVAKTPLGPPLGRPWYPWYERLPPPPAAIARMRRLYKGFLKEETPVGTPPESPQAP